MKFLVILLTLLSERYLIHAVSFTRFSWFANYAHSIEKLVSSNAISIPWLGLLILILPILLIVALICWLICGWFYGLLTLLFNLVVFFYCIGPRNPFYPNEIHGSESENEEQTAHFLFDMNRQLFATIFWYVLAGPIGALFHRLITLCQNIDSVSSEARLLTDILEWLPARMMVLLFLLAGNFQRGIKSFKKLFLSGVSENQTFIAICGMDALRTDAQDSITVTHAENMVIQSLVVLLVILALFTMVAWM